MPPPKVETLRGSHQPPLTGGSPTVKNGAATKSRKHPSITMPKRKPQNFCTCGLQYYSASNVGSAVRTGAGPHSGPYGNLVDIDAVFLAHALVRQDLHEV